MADPIPEDIEEYAGEWSGALPEAVRARVVALASDTLGAMPTDDVPTGLRPFRGWAPARRTRLAATPLAAAVDTDVLFRQAIAKRLRDGLPDLAAALDDGAAPPAADPDEVAAAAYLLRSPGWAARVAEAAAHSTQAARAAEGTRADAEVARLHGQLADAEARLRTERERWSAQRAELDAELATLRRDLRTERGDRRKAERRAQERVDEAVASIAAAQGEAAAAAAALQVQSRALDARLAEAEATLEAARHGGRERRELADVRVRLLLDALVEAGQGLRRELALPPAATRPADYVDAASPGAAGPGGSALAADDPAMLDQLLALPQAHLIVDGYNVTKTGYPDLSLEQQRGRLVTGLSSLAARSGAEVTCCFDGAAVEGRVPSMSGRGVRVLFSKPGEIADELIRRLVRAEPPGRVLVVVSSDREVADGVRRAGAHAVASAALVRRLARG